MSSFRQGLNASREKKFAPTVFRCFPSFPSTTFQTLLTRVQWLLLLPSGTVHFFLAQVYRTDGSYRRSVALKPGKQEVVIPQSDVRITNAALADQLSDESGRTTVKFTYNTPISANDLEDDDDNEVSEPLSTTVLCSLTAGKVRSPLNYSRAHS